ncbi:MAG: hypothetical protein E7635_05840 [Ruminococcaceae bacterium]|nr:hypothetical protein [Oscillospiraceae bacterium]
MKKILITLLVSAIALTMGIGISASDDLSALEFDIQAVRRVVGETVELTLLPTPRGTKLDKIGVTYTSENPAVATVDANGKVTAVAAGDTFIVAKAGKKIEARCHIFVYDAPVAPVVFVSKDRAVADTSTVVSLGDSITAYTVNPTKDGTSTVIEQGYNYHEWWGKSYRLKTHDYGWGGSKLSETECNEPSFIDRYEDMIKKVPDADLVTVMGGTNDFSSTELGDIDDRELTTFSGATRFLMERLIEAYPDSQIVFFTFTRPKSANPLDKPNVFGDTRFDYCDRIVELAKEYGIHAIDIYRVDELDFRMDSTLMADNVHPTKDAHKILADYLDKKMEEMNIITHIVRGSGFNDTLEHWGCDNIDYVVSKGLFDGVTKRKFEPNSTMTRSMLVTVLARLAGDTANTTEVPYTDLAEGAWYIPGIAFAYANGICDGGESFRPDDNITREELADMLYRYAKAKGMDTPVDDIIFADSADISASMREGMLYCANVGIITGYSDNTVKPKNSATRAEVATMIKRFIDAM